VLFEKKYKKVVVINIGKLVTGDIRQSDFSADCIRIEDGVIHQVGRKDEVDTSDVERTIDVDGMVIVPGLIDSHVHPVLGDWTPRQKTMGWIEGSLHGGITTMVSQGEFLLQGRPHDVTGIKALAILAKKTYERMSERIGVRVHAGSVILEEGLREEDFKEMADEGVRLLAEVGVAGLVRNEDTIPLVKIAKKYGMKVPMHFGAPSIPGSGAMTAEKAIELDPDLISHINGGPIAAPIKEVKKIIEETKFPVEVVHNGNPKVLNETVNLLKRRRELERLIIGSDGPTGTGVIPLSIWRVILHISSLNSVPAYQAISMATGNTGKVFGLGVGRIIRGMPADILAVDCPRGSAGGNALEAIECGDVPAVGMVMIRGEVFALQGRNTPLTQRHVKVDGFEERLGHEDYLYGHVPRF